jgi:tripartite-type tricarboxylate transporter receptor subunit TctC
MIGYSTAGDAGSVGASQRNAFNTGLDATRNTPDEFAAYIAVQHRRWKEVGQAAGVIIN